MTTKGPSSDTLQLRRGTATEWTTADPVLSAGEVGWERDTNKVKIGDGATAWTSLPYLAGTGVGVDHGVLSGLGDDDHPQYAALAQDEDVTGDWTFSGATVEVGDGTYIHGNVAGNGVRFTNAANSFFTAIIDETGTLLLPVTGSNGGLTIGGDAHLWRNAAGVFKTDANLIVDGDLTAGFTTVDYLEIVEPGATDFAFDTYVTGDSQVRFLMDASGKMAWGSGSAPPDTNLYRLSADNLATDDNLTVGGNLEVLTAATFYGLTTFKSGMYAGPYALASTDVFQTYVLGDGQYRYILNADGKLEWGPGNATQDTNLYRGAANTLQTDDGFTAGEGYDIKHGQFGSFSATVPRVDIKVSGANHTIFFPDRLQIVTGDTPAKLTFGSTEDVNLYRSAADTLATDDNFVVTGNHGVYVVKAALGHNGDSFITYAAGDANERFKVKGTGLHEWGDGTAVLDTNLYRPSANTLRTDDDFGAAAFFSATPGSQTVFVTGRSGDANWRFRLWDVGLMEWGDGTATVDTNLYRSAANILKTDDEFSVNDNILLKPAGDIKFASTLKGGSDQIILQQDGTLLLQERAAPGAPLDTTANLYTVDSGSGKGQLVIRFPSGASQIIATEP